ncbi:BTB/POZ and MATH domain-containing protein 2-like [Triticum urartu]|uniref:BTB/POZ and MATH domain-containing protein 2-like n=1 Tax=Triticum urartu TaxID=4572 RepID=UPI002044170E|nr:BTB/POZ and MATH domain-containing protein 2-like [Triticum urartu]
MARNGAAAVGHGEGLQLRETWSRCVTEGATHDFKVTNYPLLEGMGTYITSRTFRVGGYDWNIRFYPDGHTKDSEKALAFLFCLSSLTKDVRAKLTITLLDKGGKVELLTTPDRSGRLERTLKDGKGTDVTFLVGGREFSAHTFMLAAQSPIFDAQFFGPMADKDTQCIEVPDMEPAIFEMLLHFIYTDSLPPCNEKGYDAATMQHLLVAAHRYRLDRLKVMCEEKLSKSINVQTVTSTLAVADQHFCEGLKDACVEFLSARGIAGIAFLRFTRCMAKLESGDKEVSAAGTK